MNLQQYWPTDDSKCLKTTCVGIFFFILVFSFSVEISASPSEIYIQGVVRNSTTNNLTTALRDINISLVNGSTPIYSQVQSSQAIDNGVYHTTFTTIMHDWFLWPLEFVIKVGNDEFTQTEIVPVPISHAAYVANNSYYLAGHLAAEFVTDSASASWDRSAADDYNGDNLTAQTSGWDKNSADDYATSDFNTDLANSGIRTSIVNNISSVNDSMRQYVISTNASMKGYVDANSLSLVTLDNGSIIRNINQSWVLAQLGGNWQLGNQTSWYTTNGWSITNHTAANSGNWIKANQTAWYTTNGYNKANLTLDYPNLDTDSTNDLSLITLDNGSIIRNINQSWVLAQLGGNWMLANASAWYNANGYKKANLTLDYPNLDTDSTNDLSLATLDNGSIIRNINISWWTSQYALTGAWNKANFTSAFTNSGAYQSGNFTADLTATGIQASVAKNITAHEASFKHGNTTAEIRAQFIGGSNISIVNGIISVNGSFGTGSITIDNTLINLSRLDNATIIRADNTTWVMTIMGELFTDYFFFLYNASGNWNLANYTRAFLDSNITELKRVTDWSIYYSNDEGITTLPFNTQAGKYLKSNGADVLTWDTPTATVDYSKVQNFTNSNCSVGEYAFGRAQNGSWYCRADQSGNSTGLTTGSNITVQNINRTGIIMPFVNGLSYDKLIGYYPLNRNIMDYSRRNNHAFYSNSSGDGSQNPIETITPEIIFTEGKFSDALNISGNYQMVIENDVNPNSETIMFWHKTNKDLPQVETAYYYISSYYYQSGTYIGNYLLLALNGLSYCYDFAVMGKRIASGGEPCINLTHNFQNWNHYAITYTYPDIARIYQNGILVFEDISVGANISYANIPVNISIGTDYDTVHSSYARYDDIIIYNRSLSGDEIKTYYESNKELFAKPLLINCSRDILFDSGLGSSSICDGVDATGVADIDDTLINASRLDNATIIRNLNTSWVLAQLGGNWMLTNTTAWYTPANTGYWQLANFSSAFTNSGAWATSNITSWYTTNGWSSINETYNTTNQMILAVNTSGYFQHSILASNVFNVPWLQNNTPAYFSSLNVGTVPVCTYAGFAAENLTSGTIADARIAQTITRNASIIPYINYVNTTAKSYTDSVGLIINNSMLPYVISTNVSMASRVDYLNALSLKNATDIGSRNINNTGYINTRGNLTVNDFHIDKINSTHWKLWG